MTNSSAFVQDKMKSLIKTTSSDVSLNVQPAYSQCPVCNEQKPDHPWIKSKTTPTDLLSQWSVSEEINCHFDYMKCPVCGTLFVEQYPDETSLVRLYSTCSDNVYSGNDISHHRTQLNYLKILKKHVELKSNSAVLEFGPDIGVLAEAVSLANRPANYFMIEPNRGLHETLKNKIANATIWDDGKALNQQPDQTFDLIILVHVLDHMLDPIKKLEEMYRLLTPGGYLFTVTHNHDSLIRKVMGAKWPAYCLHHPQLFNGQSKHLAFSKVGFKEVVIDETVNYFPFGFLLSKFLATLGCSVNMSFGPTIKIKTGNIFGVARK